MLPPTSQSSCHPSLTFHPPPQYHPPDTSSPTPHLTSPPPTPHSVIDSNNQYQHLISGEHSGQAIQPYKVKKKIKLGHEERPQNPPVMALVPAQITFQSWHWLSPRSHPPVMALAVRPHPHYSPAQPSPTPTTAQPSPIHSSRPRLTRAQSCLCKKIKLRNYRLCN